MSKEALVVERRTLFEEGTFDGFLPAGEKDYISVILRSHSYYPRGDELENNSDIKQIITYVWIVNSAEKKVFLYKRGVNKNRAEGEYVEKRYQNKYSGGVGGHIDRDTEEGSENPIEKAMIREMEEEVEMRTYPPLKIVGYLNDDSEPIGKVHFGVVAIADTLEEVKSRDSEGLEEGKFYSLGEVEEIFSDLENEIESWTKLSWPFVKKYLDSL